MAKDIIVKVKLDKSIATSEAAKLRQDLSQVNKQVLSDSEVNARSEAEIIRRTNQAKIKAATDAKLHAQEAAKAIGKATKDAAGEGADAFGKMGDTAISSFRGITFGVASLVAGLGTAVKALKAVEDAFDEAGKKQQDFGKKALDSLEGAAQVAALQGQRQNKAFAMEQANVRARTLQTVDEVNKGQIAFRNEAEQFIGMTISKTEAQKAYEATARVAVRRNIDKEAMATLTGQTFGTADFRPLGEKGGEAAAVQTNKLMAILGAGSGDESHLARELGRMRASLIKKGDPLHGVMTDEDAAILTSLMAEIMPGQEYETGREAVRGLRDFTDPKTGPFLAKAKVTARDSPFEALAKVKTQLEDEARKRGGGTTAEDIAREVFDIRGAHAIGGLTGKLAQVQQRRDVAARVTPETMVEAETGFEKTQRGALRADAARRGLDAARRGQEMASVNIQREQARTAIQESGIEEQPGTIMKDWFAANVLRGVVDEKKHREITKQVEIMADRMPKKMGDFYRQNYGMGGPLTPMTEAGANALFLEMNRKMLDAGIDPLTGARVVPGSEEAGEASEERMGVDFGPNRGGMDLRRRKLPGEGPVSAAPGAAPAAAPAVDPKAPRPMASDEDMKKLMREQNAILRKGLVPGVPQPLIPEQKAQRR